MDTRRIERRILEEEGQFRNEANQEVWERALKNLNTQYEEFKSQKPKLLHLMKKLGLF